MDKLIKYIDNEIKDLEAEKANGGSDWLDGHLDAYLNIKTIILKNK